MGRFTQPDPSGQETNPYLYATGDPTDNIDPQGTSSFGGITSIGDWTSMVSDTLNASHPVVRG
ncbi:RHS repeat-associated core domain-containing protein [Streptomyces desertarenae]|uniref:RHS repeat-associated core domain-containing protein n=1 Tax=Streptomyces desertarenae TaxID=2666184 RepID=UPI003AA95C85